MRHPKPLARIVSTGRYLPDNVVTNDDMAKIIDTTDEWIRTRTGISEHGNRPRSRRLNARRSCSTAGTACSGR